ncbi:MAG: hypothetical protein P8X79_19250 [Reinekea sp.]
MFPYIHGFLIVGAPIGSLKFLGSKEESMACALRRYGVTDSGLYYRNSIYFIRRHNFV